MINYFAIALSHGLIAYVCWRLLLRDDLDDSSIPPPEVKPARKGRMKRPRRGATAGERDA